MELKDKKLISIEKKIITILNLYLKKEIFISKLDTSLKVNFYFLKYKNNYLILSEKEKKKFINFFNEKKIYENNNNFLNDTISNNYNPLNISNDVKSTFERIYNFIVGSEEKSKSYISLRVPLLKGKLLLIISNIFKIFFSKFFYFSILPVLLISFFIVILKYKMFIQSATSLKGFDYIYLSVALIFTTVLHEFGHAAALKYHNKTPSIIGFGFYFFMPVFYSDVTEVWELSRFKRLIIDAGGFYIEMIFATISMFLFFFYKKYDFFIIYSGSICFSILYSFNPFIKWDGYWILTDLLGLFNLHDFSKKFFKYLFEDSKKFIGKENNIFEKTKTFLSLIKSPERYFFIFFSFFTYVYLGYFYYIFFVMIKNILPVYLKQLFLTVQNISLSNINLNIIIDILFKFIFISGMLFFIFRILKSIFSILSKQILTFLKKKTL